MAKEMTIKVKRTRDEKLLMEYAEGRVKLAARLFLLFQDENVLPEMNFGAQDQHIIHLCLHLIYLDQMALNNIRTTITVDHWRQCEGTWSDFYRSAGNVYSAVRGIILLVEHWHNIKFVLKNRLSSYSIEIGDREEPLAELATKLKDGTGYAFCSGPIFQFIKATYFGPKVELSAELAYWKRDVQFGEFAARLESSKSEIWSCFGSSPRR